MTQFVNTNIINNTTSNIDCYQIDYLRNPIVNHGSDYTVSITKLYIPVGQMKLAKYSSTTDYTVGFSDTANDHSEQIYNDSSFPLYSLSDFVENVNLSMMKAYRGYLQDVLTPETFTGVTHNFTNASQTDTITVATTQAQIGGITFKINSITNNVGTNVPVFIELEAPSGETCKILQNKLITNGAGSQTWNVTFDDTSANSNTLFDGVSPSTTYNNYRTLQGTSLFNALPASVAGSWLLRVKAVNGVTTLDIDIDYDITFTLVPFAGETKSPYPPSISYDNSTGFLTLNYYEKLHSNNTTLYFSPKLHNILNFDSYFKSGNYQVKYPHRVWSSTLNEILTVRQDRQSIERVSTIAKINVYSNTLSVRPEFNSDNTSSSTITSFNPVFDTELSDLRYDYNSSTVPYRRYDIMHNGEIDKIDIGIEVLYTDGSKERLQLGPGDQFYCTLLFHPKLTGHVEGFQNRRLGNMHQPNMP